MPSIDLMYCSIVLRSLDTRILLVAMEMPLVYSWMNSAHRLDLMFFKRVLMVCTWEPVSSMILLVCLSWRRTIACFLDRPFVVT